MRAKILVEGTKEVSFSAASAHNQGANVSVKRTITYGTGAKKIILVDCGCRNSSIRSLVTEETQVVRVPWSYDYSKEHFDGIFIAGGPGDPTSCEKTVAILKTALEGGKPVFATGQGAVILAIACGASAYRMANGHRGSSVPTLDLETGRCLMTAQNHGYGIREDSLPPGWTVTGPKGLVSGVLFQPEGLPGSRDAAFLHSKFINLVTGEGAVR
jgi:carbamoyl-phosphate synthase small subunit